MVDGLSKKKFSDRELFLSIQHIDPNGIATINGHADVEFCPYQFPSELKPGKYYCRFIYDQLESKFYRLYTDPSVFKRTKSGNADDDSTYFEFENDRTLFMSLIKDTSNVLGKVCFSPQNLPNDQKYPVISTAPSGQHVKLRCNVQSKDSKAHSTVKLDTPLSDSSTLYGSASTDSDNTPPVKKRVKISTKADAQAQEPAPAPEPGSIVILNPAPEDRKLCPYFLCGICPSGDGCSLSHEFPKPQLLIEPPRNAAVFKSEAKNIILGRDAVVAALKGALLVPGNFVALDGLYVVKDCGVGIRSGEKKLRIGRIDRVVTCFTAQEGHPETQYGLVISCEGIPETEIVTKPDLLMNIPVADENVFNECIEKYVNEAARHKFSELPSIEKISELKARITELPSTH